MTSDKYFCNDKERVSCRKVAVLDAVIAVRRRLMKAVFFLSDESSDVLVGSTSDHHMSQDGGNVRTNSGAHLHRPKLEYCYREARLEIPLVLPTERRGVE